MPVDVQAKSWVQKRLGVCGGSACIRDTRITVHGLIEWKRLGRSDAEILDRTQGLTADDLHAAWLYYRQNAEEIDEAIRQNHED